MWRAITYEMPFFRYWLRDVYELPEEWGPTPRFPVKPWHHPDVVELMEETAPWRDTWDLLCRTLMRFGMDQYNGKKLPDYCWVGTCQEMVDTLKKDHEDYGLSMRDVDQLKTRSIGRYLKQIEARKTGQAVMTRSGSSGERIWQLSKNGDWKHD